MSIEIEEWIDRVAYSSKDDKENENINDYDRFDYDYDYLDYEELINN